MKEDSIEGPWVPALCLGAFTLWDFYFGQEGRGLRLFDHFGFFVITTYVLVTALTSIPLSSRRIKLPATRTALVSGFLILFIAAGIIGFVKDPGKIFRPILGIWMGLGIFLIYYSLKLSERWIQKVTGFLIVLHAAALILQSAVYHTAGKLLNYHLALGTEPRVYSSIFRPTGLFMEAGSVSVTLLMLLLLRWRNRPKIDFIFYSVLVGVVLSLSFFGMTGICAILFFSFWKRIRFWFYSILAISGLLLALRSLNRLPEVQFLTRRITNLHNNVDSDVSISTRVGVVKSLKLSDPQLWTGGGLGADYHHVGLSGGGMLVASVGIAGAVLFLALVAGLCPPDRRFYVLFAVVLLLVAAPNWTIMLWWAWIGLLCNHSYAPSNAAVRWKMIPHPATSTAA